MDSPPHNPSPAADLKPRVRAWAMELGFHLCGIAPAEPSRHGELLRRFLERGYHADMDWLAGAGKSPANVADRLDPATLLPGARSVICLAVSYSESVAPSQSAGETPATLTGGTPVVPSIDAVARYARGRDYHRLLKRRCEKLLDRIRQVAPDARAKIGVDIQPVSDRDLAAAAGLGWIGRNGCLVNREYGSWLVLAELITDLPLPPDAPAENLCGRCRRCRDACPTGALQDDGLVDCRRCISYHTVENRGTIPASLQPAMGGSIFGCDRCQAVCPFNAPDKCRSGDPELAAPRGLALAAPADVLRWTETDWDQATRGCATRRARLPMLLRNCAIACGNLRLAGAAADLHRLGDHADPVVADAARRALARLGGNG